MLNADYVLQLLMKGSIHSSFLYERSLEETDGEESPKLRKKIRKLPRLDYSGT